MKKINIAALIITLTCLLSIVAARSTANYGVKANRCVIHNLPEDVPFLLNTADGTIGGLVLYPQEWMTQIPLSCEGIVLASCFAFECQYPGIMVTSSTSSNDTRIGISRESIAGYEHRLAARYICSDCLREIEKSKPQNSILFLVNGKNERCFALLNENRHEFSIKNNIFIIYENTSTELVIRMEASAKKQWE